VWYAAIVNPAPFSWEQELAKQGVLGLVVLLLIYAIIVLWRKLAERDATIAALQEARLTEAKTNVEAITKVGAAMNHASDVQEQVTDQLRVIATEYQTRRGRP